MSGLFRQREKEIAEPRKCCARISHVSFGVGSRSHPRHRTNTHSVDWLTVPNPYAREVTESLPAIPFPRQLESATTSHPSAVLCRGPMPSSYVESRNRGTRSSAWVEFLCRVPLSRHDAEFLRRGTTSRYWARDGRLALIEPNPLS